MIYVIEVGEYFKVGYTGDWKSRKSNYNTHNPDFKIIKLYEGPLYDPSCESLVHKALKAYQHRGEWFNKFEGWEYRVEEFISYFKNYCNREDKGLKVEEYVVIKGGDDVTVNQDMLRYLASVLTQSEMNYVRTLIGMVIGEFNILHNAQAEPLTRKTLQDEINIARTTFIQLLSKLHKEGVISYLETHINRRKKVKHVVLNPRLARKNSKIRSETARLFGNLRFSERAICPH